MSTVSETGEGASYRNSRSPAGTRGLTDPSEESIIKPREILEVLVRGKWIIIVCLFVALALVWQWTASQDRVYQASTLVFVSSGKAPGSEFVPPDVVSRKISNELEIIRSGAMAHRVAARVASDAENVPDDGRESILRNRDDRRVLSEPRLAGRLRGAVRVAPISRDVDMIRITGVSTSPAEAAFIANVYAEVYEEYNRMVSRARITASREFLDQATRQFQAELNEAESDLMRFLEREGSVTPNQKAGQVVARVVSLESSQFETQTALSMAEAELSGIEAEIDRITPGLVRQLTSADDRLIDRLNEQIADRIIRLEQRYASNPTLRENPDLDPETAALRREVTSLRRELDERSARLLNDVVMGAGADLDVVASGGSATASRLQTLRSLRARMSEKQIEIHALTARNRLLSGEINTQRAQLTSLPDRQVLLNRLDRSQQIREQLYFTLVGRLQETRVAERAELGFVQIVDHAGVPGRPVSPNVERNLRLGGLLGLLLGIGITFIRHVLDNTVRRPEDVKKKGYALLGVIPDLAPYVRKEWGSTTTTEIGEKQVSVRLVTAVSPLAPAADAYRHLRTNIQFARADRMVTTILVTSPNPSEGKSLTAANIAVAMAEAGRRTILIDADLRRPSVHKTFGIRRYPGLVDTILDTGQVSQQAGYGPKGSFRTEIDDLWVVPAGKKVANPAEVIGSRRMREFLAYLQETFDVIVLDSPPVLAVADPVLVSTQADVTLMVVSAGTTDWTAAERATEIIQDVGGHVAGFILNRFDARRAYSRYARRFGVGYGYYQSTPAYTEEKDADLEENKIA
jgi:capsular exopolysaccharide synthesis family protein